MGGRGVGWGGWWQKLKQRCKMTQIEEFREAMMCSCTHKGQYTTTRPRLTCTHSGSHIKSPQLNWRPPLVPCHPPVMGVHVLQKALWKSRLVDISQWRQWTCIIIYSWCNKLNFSLCVNMSDFCSDSHINGS